MRAAALLPKKRRHRGRNAALLAPVVLAGTLGLGYAGTTALWPIAEQPVVAEQYLANIIAPQVSVPWPAEGTAALTVEGFDALAESDEALPMASVSKTLLTAMVLERMPLQPGERGPLIEFETDDYFAYLLEDQSALEVPESMTMPLYDLLLGIMLGSANNYSDLIARQLWGTNEEYVEAANDFLSRHGISGVNPHTPSGAGIENTATARGLNELGRVAMQDPVFAEIVATPVATIEGVSEPVQNHNALLGDPGVLGIKSGTERYDWMPQFEYFRNLLVAKEITVDGQTVRLFTTVLEQPSEQSRNAAARTLLTAAEVALGRDQSKVPAGTVVGTVTTEWGETADVITRDEASVLAFNQSIATITVDIDLGEVREQGQSVGTLTLTGTLGSETVDVVLSSTIEQPSILWRWTHPLEVF